MNPDRLVAGQNGPEQTSAALSNLGTAAVQGGPTTDAEEAG